jgi:hypothetical protein
MKLEDVLELMHLARRRYTTIEARIRRRFEPALVEALSPSGADPALGDAVSPRRADRDLHDAEALGPEHLVDPDPELAEFALDPYATPPRVLPAETDDEIGRVGIERGSTRTSPTVGPLPLDKLAMPAKQRLRRDHERCPAVPGECSARRREERPIPIAKLRAADRPSEHLHLVAQDGVLELKLGNAPMSGERPDEAKEDEVDEGSQRARMLPISVNQTAESSFGAPHLPISRRRPH